MQEVTVSRLPESVLDELEDYLEQQDLDPYYMHAFKSLLRGYDAAWDELERLENAD